MINLTIPQCILIAWILFASGFLIGRRLLIKWMKSELDKLKKQIKEANHKNLRNPINHSSDN